MFLHVPFNIGIHMIIDVCYGRLTFASIFEKSLYIIMFPSEVYDQKSFLKRTDISNHAKNWRNCLYINLSKDASSKDDHYFVLVIIFNSLICLSSYFLFLIDLRHLGLLNESTNA